MQWIAPSEKDALTDTLEKRLWDTADQFRANSGLKAQEYSGPILGIIFLRFAEVRFAQQRTKLEKASASSRRGSRVDEPAAYHADGILYLAPNARFEHLLNLPEAADIGAKVNEAMRDIEKHNPQLAGILPKTFNLFTSTLLKELLKKVSEIPAADDKDRPPSIDSTDRTEVLCVIRQVFNDGNERDRETAIREIAHALGYQRTGSRIQEILSTDLRTAVLRGIVQSENGTYRLGFRSFAECTRDSLKEVFAAAIGRTWITRDDAVRAFARHAGFARVGDVIDQTARSVINGLIRESRLDTDGTNLIRRA